MATIFDENASELINRAGIELKKTKNVQIPEWAHFVKTGVGKERVPDSKDWWYMRAGSILRKIYVNGPIGVSKLRKLYGCKKNRGVKPEEFRKASGKIIRVILQQLEAEGFVKAVEKGIHKGKIITPKGKAFLDGLVKDGTGGNKTKKNAGAAKPGATTESPGATESAETN